jgi:DMSO/TMAO reductase YedYZ molybdopterin-dependent catalytic subunit
MSEPMKEFQGQPLSPLDDFRENSIKGPPRVDITAYRLAVTGLVNCPLSLTYEDAIKRYKSVLKLIRLDCVEGWSSTVVWEGFAVADLLREASPATGATMVIFRCLDGYDTSLPLDFVMSGAAMLAYRMNGVALPVERGYPFHLVAERKWAYKWARWVSQIELSADSAYRGYWEQRGYSAAGDLDKEFLEL